MSASSARISTRLNANRRNDPAETIRTASGKAMVYVVDDDVSMREVLVSLLRSVGLQAEAFASAAELMGVDLQGKASCLVMDIRLPGLSGLDFQAYLRRGGIRVPIVFMTGHADIPMTVRAMKAGAIEFLTKPFREQEMLDAVFEAIKFSSVQTERDQRGSEIFERFETLSDCQREVMALITAGAMNKQAAAKVGVAISTIKTHRAQIMKKMGARSFADLVRMAEIVRLAPAAKVHSL